MKLLVLPGIILGIFSTATALPCILTVPTAVWGQWLTPELDNKGIDKALTQELGTKFVFLCWFFFLLYGTLQWHTIRYPSNFRTCKGLLPSKKWRKGKQSNRDLHFLPRCIWTGCLRIPKLWNRIFVLSVLNFSISYTASFIVTISTLGIKFVSLFAIVSTATANQTSQKPQKQLLNFPLIL